MYMHINIYTYMCIHVYTQIRQEPGERSNFFFYLAGFLIKNTQEECPQTKSPTLKHPTQILRGGSSSSGFLFRQSAK